MCHYGPVLVHLLSLYVSLPGTRKRVYAWVSVCMCWTMKNTNFVRCLKSK